MIFVKSWKKVVTFLRFFYNTTYNKLTNNSLSDYESTNYIIIKSK
jgi:hypothetical protein